LKSIIHAYGAKRCLWGSDFPFIQDRWSYSSSLEWIYQLEDLSDEDRSWILGGTAKALWW
jgi:predicted TIM-barrel fold metal-dependent hydrolase